uniref:Uncharacterized protein n=1 Tax=Anguilla anguilla TaxID=7936 RepID=A0A0E9VGU9_ANGAN
MVHGSHLDGTLRCSASSNFEGKQTVAVPLLI